MQHLPFKLTTHTQHSYDQELIESESEDAPVFRSTSFDRHVDAYVHLVMAFQLANKYIKPTKSTPDFNIFTPSISLSSIKDKNIQQKLTTIAYTAQLHYQQHIPQQSQEYMCDHVFTPPLDGFGLGGLQVYFKHGFCISWLHDEVLWMAALNHMMKDSIGCALWIAIGLHDLKQTLSIMKIDDLLVRKDTSLMEVGKLLDELIKSGTHIEYVFQRPGQLVSSPAGIGAAHLVISNGTFISQLAWNLSFTIPGAIECLSFWGEQATDRDFGHVFLDNGSQATRAVIPLFTMEEAGYLLNLSDKLKSYNNIISIIKDKLSINIEIHPTANLTHCSQCLYRQDWKRINKQCIHCFLKSPKVLKLLK
jgi:hypothetical protein